MELGPWMMRGLCKLSSVSLLLPYLLFRLVCFLVQLGLLLLLVIRVMLDLLPLVVHDPMSLVGGMWVMPLPATLLIYTALYIKFILRNKVIELDYQFRS